MHIRTVTLSAILAMATSAAQAEGWNFLPVTDAGFKAEPTLSLMGGMLNPDVNGADSDTAMGVELSFNCIALQPPSGKIRTQISWTRYDDAGLEINSVEVNPHYLWRMTDKVEIGVGPGLGYVSGKAGAVDESMLAMQLGTSLHYRSGNLFMGAEARYQVTEEEFGNTDLDNFRVMLKVGYNF